jgi:peptide/nickel transport system substrate-binding protein
VRNTALGTGAWMLEEHQPSVIVKLRRNPNWYGKDRPYLDGWDIIIVPDYAQGVAQLKAGNLDTYAVRQEDVIATKGDALSLVLTQQPSFPKNNGGWLYFGLQGDSPFNDERVRKAFSMEIDRDAWVDTFSNKQRFTDAGLPADHALSNFAGAGFSCYMDPRGKEMGDAAAFFQYSPAEAKKLLSAAGFTSPINVPFVIPAVGADQQPQALAGGITAVGDFKLDFKSINFQQDFIPNYQVKKGDFKGVIYLGQAESPDFDWVMYNTFYKNSANFYSKTEDPKVTQLIDGQRRENDHKKRDDLLKDFQRYVGSKMYVVPMPGTWKVFNLSQPWIGNYGYYIPWLGPTLGGAGPSQASYPYYWSDDSKRKS